MNWNSLFQFALQTLESQAKKVAIQEIQRATNHLSEQINKHAPDMQTAAQAALSSIAQAAVAGVLTKKN